jgi:hypothetical protein
MSKLASLLTRSHRSMLRSVDRSLWRVAAFGAACLGQLLSSATAAAQQAPADDSGWFDAPAEAESVDDPYYLGPTSAEPAPSAPSAPSPAPPPAPAESQVEDTDPSALTTFRPALDPYGVWVNDPTYGTVWVPNAEVVGADFAPYVSRGRWSLTAENDWIWVSDYPFGWAVFHYGRWVWISGSGWAWIPGRTYANAWVVWRVPTAGYAYVGWAPMPPLWGWRAGYAFSLWYSPPLPYVFCPSAYIFDYRVHYHVVHDRHLVREIAANTRVYPTPYRAPAAPSIHGAAAPARATRIAPSMAPRGPAMSAARVPAQAMPVQRSAPPPAAARLASPRYTSPSLARDSLRRVDTSPRIRSVRPEPRDALGARDPYSAWSSAPRSSWSSAPRSSWSSAPRPSAAPSVRVEPRSSLSPARVHVTPSMPRTYSSSPSSAPIRSFSPSMPRLHSGGGGFRRR